MKNILGVNYYDLKDASTLLGLTPTSLRNYIKDGRLGGLQIGRKYYTTEEDIKTFLEEHRTGTPKQEANV